MEELSQKQKKATAESLLEEAKTCARKLCAYGGCTTKYSKCVDKTRIGKNAIKPFGKGKTCPLAKYNIPTDTTPYIERLRSGEDSWPSEDEYFATCANCRHSKIYKDEENDLLMIKHDEDVWENYCMDCPVHCSRDAKMELLAEAMIS